jgi:NitT/TauT family transport system substrate-binding protein
MKLAILAALAAVWVGNGARCEPIAIMVGGLSGQIYLPAMLAERIGAYKTQGLDVRLSDAPGGAVAENAMLAGEVQGVVGFYDHTIDLQAKGKFCESVVQLGRAPGLVELVSSRIADGVKTFADLKGRSLGVTTLGSSTDFLTHAMAARAGLKPGEVTTVAVGAGNTFLAALKQGAIDGGMTFEPTISRVLHEGIATVLVDMRTIEGTRSVLGGTYPGASLYMTEAYVKAHPDTVQKLANAYVATLRFIATHTPAQLADLMPPDYYARDKEMYVSSLAAGMAMFTPDGRMPEDGPPTVLAVLSAFKKELQSRPIDLARTYTTEFVDRVPADRN